jgi:hypothetical protein
MTYNYLKTKRYHIIKQLKHIAIDENKTLTQVIQEALDEYVKQKKKGSIKI